MDIRSIYNEALLQLYKDLRAEAERVAARRSITVDLDEIKGDETAMFGWTPDPVHADPMRSSFSRRLRLDHNSRELRPDALNDD